MPLFAALRVTPSAYPVVVYSIEDEAIDWEATRDAIDWAAEKKTLAKIEASAQYKLVRSQVDTLLAEAKKNAKGSAAKKRKATKDLREACDDMLKTVRDTYLLHETQRRYRATLDASMLRWREGVDPVPFKIARGIEDGLLDRREVDEHSEARSTPGRDAEAAEELVRLWAFEEYVVAPEGEPLLRRHKVEIGEAVVKLSRSSLSTAPADDVGKRSAP